MKSEYYPVILMLTFFFVMSILAYFNGLAWHMSFWLTYGPLMLAGLILGLIVVAIIAANSDDKPSQSTNGNQRHHKKRKA